MHYRLSIFLLTLICTLSLNAQVENPKDSLPKIRVDSLQPQPSGFITSETLETVGRTVHPFEAKDINTLNNMPQSQFKPNLELKSDIAHWEGGALYGMNGTEVIYGTGAVRNATAIAYQNIGNLRLTGSASFEKYNFYRNIGNGFAANLIAEYTFNRNVGVTAFGNMHNMGFGNGYTSYHYGGFFSFTTNNNKWGIDLGARRYYNPVTHQWSTDPIVMPYYKFNGQKLGVDIGGILKSIFISVGENASPHTIKPTPEWHPGMPPPHRW